MQAMFMSKQVKHIISGPEILHFLLESIMKYNSFVNPFKTDIIISHYNATMYYICMYITMRNAGAGYKEVTLKNHGNNGLAILHGNMKYTE